MTGREVCGRGRFGPLARLGNLLGDEFQIPVVKANGLGWVQVEDCPAIGLPVVPVETEYGSRGPLAAERVHGARRGIAAEILHLNRNGHEGRKLARNPVSRVGYVIFKVAIRPPRSVGPARVHAQLDEFGL